MPDYFRHAKMTVLPAGTWHLAIDQTVCAAARAGIALLLDVAASDQIEQMLARLARDDDENMPHLVFAAIDHRWLGIEQVDAFRDSSAVANRAIARIDRLIALAGTRVGWPLILPTIPVPPVPLFGSLERLVPGTPRATIAAINDHLVGLARAGQILLFDLAATAEQIGTDTFFDERLWAAFKVPFAAEAVPLVAHRLGSFVAAILGVSRKCLVLDLDETCWGGAIGDLGVARIELGPGSPRGEAFSAVQRLARQLRDRGVILAVSSKNEEDTVRGPFLAHPEMILREDDISVFQVNRAAKSANLRAIAEHLSIGLEALVLLDDNPAERAEVRAACPTLAVPELPEDPALFATTLAAAGYFDVAQYTSEDAARAASYAHQTRRAALKEQVATDTDYLRELDMRLRIERWSDTNSNRIVQLVGRTNQFNLTGIRISEAEVLASAGLSSDHVVAARLDDRFSDLGLIAVLRARLTAPRTWTVDLFAMSCRALDRAVEDALIADLVAAARRVGVAQVIGRYRPTERNQVAAGFWRRFGFSECATVDGVEEYALEVSAFKPADLPLRVESTR